MAYLEQRNAIYRIVFRLNGERFSRSLGTKSESAAKLTLAKLEDGLQRLKLGFLQLEPEDDVLTVLLSSGSIRQQPTVQKAVTFGRLLDDYLESIPADSIEESSRGMLETHVRNLKRHLGTRLSTAGVGLAKLQGYINSRSKDPGIRGNRVSPVTIRKEITTLHAAWTWAKEASLVSVALPRKARLRYPKRTQKEPFKTWEEIERIIENGNLSETQQREYWDCLFLNDRQIDELCRDVALTETHACIHAMISTAAYTGARRSELLRSRLEDIDLESNKFTIREKKRVRSQHSTRSVPICSTLRQVLANWLEQHPGGTHSFSMDGSPISRDQAHDHFARAVKNTKNWSRLRGWHVLRHSFISICASNKIDQRIIDDWVGHQTEAMRKRYRHLFPNIQQSAIESVFATKRS